MKPEKKLPCPECGSMNSTSLGLCPECLEGAGTALPASLDEFKEQVRGKILSTLDGMVGGKGWLDSDLSDLFPAIDRQAEKMFNRK